MFGFPHTTCITEKQTAVFLTVDFTPRLRWTWVELSFHGTLPFLKEAPVVIVFEHRIIDNSPPEEDVLIQRKCFVRNAEVMTWNFRKHRSVWTLNKLYGRILDAVLFLNGILGNSSWFGSKWATKTPFTFHYTGCLIGIVMMLCFNPNING